VTGRTSKRDHKSDDEVLAEGSQEMPFQTGLIIEPDILPRMALQQQLLQLGVTTIHEAENGEDGMAWLSSRGVDLVFSTWEPGGISGIEILRYLKGNGRTPRIPVVILDDGMAKPAVVTAVKEGIAGLIHKPPRLENTREVMESLLEQHALKKARKNNISS